MQISVEEAVGALEPTRWEISVAEERPRPMAGTGVDAVVCATARGRPRTTDALRRDVNR